MSTPARPAPTDRRRRRPAWLAIVALLINALLPAAVIAASPYDRGGGAGLCSAAAGSGGTAQPGQSRPAAVPRHCALCLAAAPGVLPAPPAGAVIAFVAGRNGPVRAARFIAPRVPANLASRPRPPPAA